MSKTTKERKECPGYEGSWLRWTWRDEKAYINQLGRPYKSKFQEEKDRWYSDKTRLEQLQQYLYCIWHVRDTPWVSKEIAVHIIPYLEKSIEQEKGIQ